MCAEYVGHSHALIATLERNPAETNPAHMYSIKLFKQKQFIDGCLFILQEIYGIENKSTTTKPPPTFAGAHQQVLDYQLLIIRSTLYGSFSL